MYNPPLDLRTTYTDVACGYGNVRVNRAAVAGIVAVSRPEGFSPYKGKFERFEANSDIGYQKKKPPMFHAKKDSSLNARHFTIYRGLKVIYPQI